MEYNRAKGCAKCGLMNGEMFTCAQCSDSYHSRTCVSDSEKINSKCYWRCSQCVSKVNRPFRPCDVTSNEEYYTYLDLFSLETADGLLSEPTLGAILLRMEWVLTKEKISDVAKCVSKYFSVVRDNGHSGENALFHPSKTLNFHRLIDGLRLIIGYEEFNSIYNQLANQEITLSMGMAPSLQFFIRKCYTCGAFRYLRSFCFNCGSLFNVKADACRDMNILASSSHYKRNRESSTSSSNLTTNSASSRDSDVPVTKYEEIALRGMKRFVSVAKKSKYYHHFGGDIFFLLRHLATNTAPGVLREFATQQFKQMVNRWLESPPYLLNEEFDGDDEPHFHGCVSSCQVIQCLVNPDDPVRRMFLEPPNIPAAKYLQRLSNESSASLESRGGSGGDSSGLKRAERKEREEMINRVKYSLANSVAPTNRDSSSFGTPPSATARESSRGGGGGSGRRQRHHSHHPNTANKRMIYNIDEDMMEEMELSEQEAHDLEEEYVKMAVRDSLLSSAEQKTKKQKVEKLERTGERGSRGGSGGDWSSDNGVKIIKSEGERPKAQVSVKSGGLMSDVIDLTVSSDDEKETVPTVAVTPKKSTPVMSTISVKVRTPTVKQVVQILTPTKTPTAAAPSISTPDTAPQMTAAVPPAAAITGPTRSNVTALSAAEAAKGLVRVSADDAISLQSLSDDEYEVVPVVKKEPLVKTEPKPEPSPPSVAPSAAAGAGAAVPTFNAAAAAMSSASKPKERSTSKPPVEKRKVDAKQTLSKKSKKQPESDSSDEYYSSEEDDDDEDEERGPRVTRSSRNGTSTSSSSSSSGGGLLNQATFDRRDANGRSVSADNGTGIVPVTRHREILDSVPLMDRLESTLMELKSMIMVFIGQRGVTELVNIDPNEQAVPMTPRTHCQHCGANNHTNGARRKNSSNNNSSSNSLSKSGSRNSMSDDAVTEEDVRYCCGENGKRCGYPIIPSIDYGSLCDRLCWCYFFECLGIDIDPKNVPSRRGDGVFVSSLNKVVRQLPVMRSYSSLGEMGVQFYKHQCYFVTHLIYIFSSYGQHTLRRQLFAEEFYFMVTQMHIVIHSLEDVEIVGEFVHCLQILQYCEEDDPELVGLIQEARDFLVQREFDLEQCGKFMLSKNARDQYHSGFCGVVALMDSVFTRDENARWNPPRSHILSMLH